MSDSHLSLSRLDDNSTTKKASNMGFSGFVSGFGLVLIHKSNSIKKKICLNRIVFEYLVAKSAKIAT